MLIFRGPMTDDDDEKNANQSIDQASNQASTKRRFLMMMNG